MDAMAGVGLETGMFMTMLDPTVCDFSEPEEEGPSPSGEDAAPAEPASEEPRILLKIKSAVHQDGLPMRIPANAPFRRLYKGFEDAGAKGGWLPPGANVALLVDGEKLDPDDTPSSMDLEDSDVIDARW